MLESFSLAMAISALVGREYQVAINDHAHWETGPDGDGRLDVGIAATDLLAGLVQAVGAAAPERRHDGAVVVGGTELRADAEHRRERRRHGEPAPVVIHVVL